MNDDEQLCHICNSKNLTYLDKFEKLCRVTSDAKPYVKSGKLAICGDCNTLQKLVCETWDKEVKEIYENYSLYFQSNTSDQIIYDQKTNSLKNRAEVIVEKIVEYIDSSREEKNFLDFGCGKGAFLKAFSKTFPDWNIYGADSGDIQEDDIRKLPKFREYYSCGLNEIEKNFDLISLIHVLEHIPSPIKLLEDIKRKLSPSGLSVIQVPNASINQIDLVIADHCSHFTVKTLKNILIKSDLEIVFMSENWISKEITCIVKKNLVPGKCFVQEDQLSFEAALLQAQSNLSLLVDAVKNCKKIIKKFPNYGIFGTSIAAVWLDTELNKSAQFFCDEDLGRINKEFIGRKVRHPKEVGLGSIVLMPMVGAVGKKIAARYENFETIYCFR